MSEPMEGAVIEAALQITAGPGWLLEDPLGNRIYTTEFIVVPRP